MQLNYDPIVLIPDEAEAVWDDDELDQVALAAWLDERREDESNLNF